MNDSQFTGELPSNIGTRGGLLPTWTHVCGTRQPDSGQLGTEPPAIDQTVDWESFVNLDQDELSFIPSGSNPSPLDIDAWTFRYYELSRQEATFYADRVNEQNLELEGLGNNSNAGSLTSLSSLPRKRKFGDLQEGDSGGPNGSRHSGGGTSQGRGKGQKRISKKAKATLMAWLEKNRQDPYPDKKGIEDLSVSVGLDVAKVRNWLNNARRRHLPKFSPAVSTAEIDGRQLCNGDIILDENLYEAQIPQGPLFCEEMAPHRNTTTRKTRQLSPPMERYLASPPEHEAAPLAAVEAAAENAEFNFEYVDCVIQEEAWIERAEGVQTSADYDGISTSGSGRSVISTSNISYSSLSSQYPRKGRRRTSRTLPNLDTSSKFQCTFCSKGFQTKHDWKRHEESRHVPQEEWVCMLDSTQIALCKIVDGKSVWVCMFCGSADTSDEHLESAHNIHTCLSKDIPERTFTRKDHLVQHIRHTHRAVGETPYVQNWSRPIRYDHGWICGFCGARMCTWSARVSHVSRHFAKQLRMDSWVHNTDPALPERKSEIHQTMSLSRVNV
ncbi:hypothetical protein GP486_004446 [Trichoglossum hirsutum]|uniref:Uncharacterized protein n=1 Tax=Trichoglossum hirsutum TaxID=265104 RepID=A0A9P8LBD1_9PEZI|nr:hypothetical protein GP486_004446 [Trichoglossum hirsutum]